MNPVARIALAAAPLLVSWAVSACSGGSGGPGGPPPNGGDDSDGSSDGSPNGTQAQFDACLEALGTAQQMQACALFPQVMVAADAQRSFTAALATGVAACTMVDVSTAPNCYAKADCDALASLEQARAMGGIADMPSPTGDGTCRGVSW